MRHERALLFLAPFFRPLKVPPESEGEEVRFRSADGLELAGTYLKARTESRAGVVKPNSLRHQ